MLRTLEHLFRGVARRDARQQRFTDYADYVAAQIAARDGQAGSLSSAELVQLAHIIREFVPAPRFGLCGGIGDKELRALQDLLDCDVERIEMASINAESRHHTDELFGEWRGKIDFIYLQSLDRSTQSLERWSSCLSPQGRCFVRSHRDSIRGGGAELIEKVGVLEETVEASADGEHCVFVCRGR